MKSEIRKISIKELKNKFINNGLLPVCAWCGLVRDKQDKWMKLNIQKWALAGVGLTHGICPTCTVEVY